jgi:eukaryotic-like serine/threonine-protein kinase
MALKKGTRLGVYEISAPLGVGGMGEVYRAADTRLKRDVAIKTLLGVGAGDASRLTRFEQEARVLASLNHPHIASIYGIEQLDGVPCLVLELVEGPTLAERLAKGALPAKTTLDFGVQIAAALEAAHGKGIIHRDLKPGNIKVTPEGKVKVLDFGLAKILETEAPPPEASQLTTVEAPYTHEGAVVGTFPYMSPEQVRGERLDFRTDIWAYGCVLYEMVTGRRAFSAKTPAEVGAAILAREPDWDTLRGKSTPGLERLIRRCLRKDPRRRLHDIADARIELEEAQEEPAGTAEALPAPAGLRRWRGGALWALAGLLAGALIAIFVRNPGSAPTHPTQPTVRASLTLAGGPAPVASAIPSVTVSPDGRTVVFPSGDRLYRRALESTAAEPIPGSEGGWAPSFSPDGEWLAFFAGMHLRKIPVAGGTPIDLWDLPPVGCGLSWAPDGRIIVARSFNGPLYAVAAGAGEPLRLTSLEPDEHSHRYPQALPGGRLLYTAVVGRDFQDLASARIVALDLGTRERRVVLEGATYARYVGDGWMVFVRGQSVFAVPFDLARLQVTGSPVTIAETMTVDPEFWTAQFDVTRDGTLVYVNGPAEEMPSTEVLRLDRHGHETRLAVPPGAYEIPSLSPDGRRLALGRRDGQRTTVLVFERDRQLLTSVVPEPGRFFGPTWSPDGRRLALASVFHGDPRLVVRAADGSGSMESPTPQTDDAEIPTSWSPDGRTIAYTVVYAADQGSHRHFTSDIWLASADGSSPPHPWMETPHSERGARFSPDGRFLAYVSDESGRQEVYLRPLVGQEKMQISSEGGSEPLWAAGGREILFRNNRGFFAVDLGPGPAMHPGRPRLLFAGRFDIGWDRPDYHHTWSISSDGQEFIVLRTTYPPEPPRELRVVTGWLAGLGHPLTR